MCTTIRNYACPEKVSVIGVPISAVTMESVLKYVDENFELIRGEYICASNVHTTVMAYENQAYMRVQCGSVISLPDGKPLSVIGRRSALGQMEKVTGTHFMQNIFTDPRFAGKKHFFYGTAVADLERMIAKVRLDYPDLQICGYEPSVFRELNDAEVWKLASEIDAAKADFIWVAIGAPRQDQLMYRLQGKVNGVMVGVGGAFNILSGLVNDAPMWMQNAGLEWFYRLIKEPRRLFKRYLVTNSKFIWYVLFSNQK